MNIYGSPDPDASWVRQHQDKIYQYFKKRIELELINPNNDEENRMRLLEEICKSDTAQHHRVSLVKQLMNHYEE